MNKDLPVTRPSNTDVRHELMRIFLKMLYKFTGILGISIRTRTSVVIGKGLRMKIRDTWYHHLDNGDQYR